MSGLGEVEQAFNVGYKAQPSDLDRYEFINTGILSVSSTWVGTAAGGTNAQAKALVLINTLLDYPRNLLYGVVGTNDVGGTWVVNGYDQFGVGITETVGNGTAAAGTPAWSKAGTKIFQKVTSGTYTFAVGSAGNGSPQLGVAIGTQGGSLQFRLGLLTKIAGSTDVKAITWSKSNVVTTLNGGTIGAYVDVTNHAIQGSAVMGGTEAYTALVKTTFDNKQKANLAGL